MASDQYTLIRSDDGACESSASALVDLFERFEPSNNRNREAALVIASDDVLEIAVSLPGEARRDLRDLLAFEIERRTPFAREDVYYGWRVSEPVTANGIIEVDVRCVLRNTADNLIASVRNDSKLIPVRVSASGRVAPDIALIDHVESTSLPNRRLRWSLITLASILLLAAMYAPLNPARERLRRMEMHLAELRSSAAVEAAERSEAQMQWTAIEFLNVAEASYIPRLQVLAELTRIVPKNAWVSELKIREQRVEIFGEAENANSLITLLSESGMFFEPRFSAPLTSNSENGFEQFAIQANFELSK